MGDECRRRLEPKLKAWSEEHGKKKQIRALLASLHLILCRARGGSRSVSETFWMRRRPRSVITRPRSRSIRTRPGIWTRKRGSWQSGFSMPSRRPSRNCDRRPPVIVKCHQFKALVCLLRSNLCSTTLFFSLIPNRICRPLVTHLVRTCLLSCDLDDRFDEFVLTG